MHTSCSVSPEIVKFSPKSPPIKSESVTNKVFVSEYKVLPAVELKSEGWVSSKGSPQYQFSHFAFVNPDDVTPPPDYPNHPLVRKEVGPSADACLTKYDLSESIGYIEVTL